MKNKDKFGSLLEDAWNKWSGIVYHGGLSDEEDRQARAIFYAGAKAMLEAVNAGYRTGTMDSCLKYLRGDMNEFRQDLLNRFQADESQIKVMFQGPDTIN